MENFIFKNPTKLIFGKGQIAQLTKEIPSAKRIMITMGGGSVLKNGVYDQVKEALKNHHIVEFKGIEPNPKFETLLKAVELAKSEKIDFLLAVGGGSVIDGTKFIALAMNYKGADPWEIVINPKEASVILPIPLAAVLTLPATGSEMNCGAVISRLATKEKFAIHNSYNYPNFSILDPEVCFSLPERQIANGLIDTYVHVMEQYLTYPSDGMVQDRFNEGVLHTILEIAPKIVKDRKNYQLMANFMLSATMGLNGFTSMGVPQDWATHMIGHELTALVGLDHGVTLAIIAPYLYDVMRAEKREKLLQYGERIFDIKEGSEEQRIDKAIEKTKDFFESMGVKCSLSSHGVTKDNCDTIVKRFTERGVNFGERGTITPCVVKTILEKAF